MKRIVEPKPKPKPKPCRTRTITRRQNQNQNQNPVKTLFVVIVPESDAIATPAKPITFAHSLLIHLFLRAATVTIPNEACLLTFPCVGLPDNHYRSRSFYSFSNERRMISVSTLHYLFHGLPTAIISMRYNGARRGLFFH